MANSLVVQKHSEIAKKSETKSDRFRRLANGRANEAINALYKLGNLAGPNYEYTDEQISVLQRAITDATTMAFQKLRTRTAARRVGRELI